MLVITTQNFASPSQPANEWVHIFLPDGRELKVTARVVKNGKTKSTRIFLDGPKDIKILRSSLLKNGEKEL